MTNVPASYQACTGPVLSHCGIIAGFSSPWSVLAVRNFNENTIFSDKNIFENVIFKMLGILFSPQYVAVLSQSGWSKKKMQEI